MSFCVAVEALYEPKKGQKGLDADNIPLEVDSDHIAVVRCLLDGIDDPKNIINEKFLRCCSDLLATIDTERLAQGRDPYTYIQRVFLVRELFRSFGQYKGTSKETRKDGTNTFYSHLVGSIKYLVQDCGFTGIVPVLAMLKHDTVEDFISKDRLEEKKVEASREAVRAAIRHIAPDVIRVISSEVFTEMGIGMDYTSLPEAVPFSTTQSAAMKRLKAALEDLEKTKRKVGDATDDISKKRVESKITCIEKVLREMGVREGTYAENRERNAQEQVLYGGLLDSEPMDSLIEKYAKKDPISIRVIAEEVKALVKGMTKLKIGDPDATSEEALRRLLTVAEHHPRVIVCKCSDRAQNASDLHGHGNDERGLAVQKRIMTETVDVHLQMAELYRIRELVKKLVHHACDLFNPDVNRFFRNKSKRRLRERMNDKVRGGVLEKIKTINDIEVVEFIPIDLAHYLDRIDKPIQDVALDDMKKQIDYYDPMFEIVVLVEPKDDQIINIDGADFTYLQAKERLRKAQEADNRAYFNYVNFEIPKAGGDVSAADVKSAEDRKAIMKNISDGTFCELKLAREILQRFSFEAMNKVAHSIAERFASRGSRTIINAPDKDDPDRALGFRFSVFNKELGGRLDFRVNDKIGEALSKRGELAYVDDNPVRIKEAIGALLRRQVAKETGIVGVKEGAKEELFKKQIVVYTPEREPIRLFVGDTGFDFAAAVHSDLLVGAQRIYEKDSVTKGTPEREINLWEKLEDGKTYRIETCLPLESAGKRKPGKIIAHPLWLQFCGRKAAMDLRRYFRDVEEVERGTNYRMGVEIFAEIATMFSISGLDLMNLLLRKYGKRYSSGNEITRVNVVEIGKRILKDLGRGEINLLSLLAQAAGDSRKLLAKKYGRKLDTLTKEPSPKAPEDGMQGGTARDRQIIELQKNISDTNVWMVEVDVSEEGGSFAEFSAEFSKEVGIVIKHISHVLGRLPIVDENGRITRRGTKGKLLVTFDLNQAQISEYELFKKIFELQMEYRVRVVEEGGNVRKKYVSSMRQNVGKGDFVLTDEIAIVFDSAGSGYGNVLRSYRRSRKKVSRRR